MPDRMSVKDVKKSLGGDHSTKRFFLCYKLFREQETKIVFEPGASS